MNSRPFFLELPTGHCSWWCECAESVSQRTRKPTEEESEVSSGERGRWERDGVGGIG